MNLGTNEFTLLSNEQIARSQKIDVIKQLGGKCTISDFAILLGGYVDNYCYVDDDRSLKGRTGEWFSSSPYTRGDMIAVNSEGSTVLEFSATRKTSVRPVLPFSNSADIPKNGVRGKSGLLEIEYGEYPQYAVDESLGRILEREFSRGNLRKTGKTYTTDSSHSDRNYRSGKFSPGEHEEFEYNGKKYVRVKSNCLYNGLKLSNGVKIMPGDYVWVEVSPITWYVDERSNMLVSKILLASGIRFCDDKSYFGDFKNTEMYMFLNKYFAKDIMQSNVIINSHKMTDEEKERHERRQNPYKFSFNEVNEEEIIKGAVESNVPVFLHGRSSEGKSARIKELDSDCEIIYMRNATPDSLNGKSVYNQETGEMIDVKPSWLVKLEEKCEKEPDKIHIVFFDELTNALPSIQGMAFNIVLDREVNGKWSLPKNARIAAAGNDMEDSLAANQMAEPLFNRFAHVYIETTTEDWLKWAITPEEDYKRLDYKEEKPPLKIHPAIYAYICMNGNALRSEYTGEKPNADPRKWEMASKVLYKTGNPQMLRALVGEDITKEFVEFCNLQAISLEDVLNDNYSEVEIQELNTAERYSTTVGLSQVTEENLGKVRRFVMKLGPEFGSIFDAIWTHGDEKRLELIAEEKLMEQGMGGINNGR